MKRFLFIQTLFLIAFLFGHFTFSLADNRALLPLTDLTNLLSSRHLSITDLNEIQATRKYVLQNVETGSYLSNGANWGTQLVLENVGIALIFEPYGLDKYRLYTGCGDGYIDINGNIDGLKENYTDFIINKVSTDQFTISAVNNKLLKYDKTTGIVSFVGNDASASSARWRILDEEILYYMRLSQMPLTTSLKPEDATYLIPWGSMENARIPGKDEWKIESNGANVKYGIWQIDAIPVMEFWYPYSTFEDSKITQKIWLPQGKYKLQVQSFYRDGDPEEVAYSHRDGGEELRAYLFAGNERTRIQSIFNKTSPQYGPAWNYNTVLGFVPNDYTSAAYAFKQGFYDNELTFTVAQDGYVPLGIEVKMVENDNSWCPFANFRLTYYGPTTISNSKYYIRNVDTGTFLSGGAAWGTQAIMDKEGLDFTAAFLGNGKYTLYSGYYTDLYELEGALGSIGFVDRSDNNILEINNTSGGIFSIKGDNNMFLTTNIESCAATFTATNSANAKAQWQFVPEAVVAASRAAELPLATTDNPIDVSYMIPGRNQNRLDSRVVDNWLMYTGEDFDWDRLNWNIGTGVATASASIEDNSITEIFRSSWTDPYSVLCEKIFLPTGSYTMKMQGFYRDGSLIQSSQRRLNGEENRDAYLYIKQGEQETMSPIRSIFDEVHELQSQGWSAYSSVGGYVPNTMADAGIAFSKGVYDNSIDFNVTTPIGDYVQLGVYCAQSDYIENWLAFDNFRLYYYGPEIRLAPSHTIKYIVDGEVYYVDQINENASISTVTPPEKEGYTFVGWEGLPSTMGNTDISVNAIFQVNTYHINYYVGPELWISDPVKFGEPVVLRMDYKPENSQHIFSGWLGDKYETMPAHDITYIASIVDGISEISTNNSKIVDVYSLEGKLLLQSCPMSSISSKLSSGIYIVNGELFVVK